jgi:hypothetical protein
VHCLLRRSQYTDLLLRIDFERLATTIKTTAMARIPKTKESPFYGVLSCADSFNEHTASLKESSLEGRSAASMRLQTAANRFRVALCFQSL